jgi:hypothetical protein
LLTTLKATPDACRATGRGRAVYIRGEAGIGKTRLLHECLAMAREKGFACHAGLVLDFGAGAGRDAISALARDLLGFRPAATRMRCSPPWSGPSRPVLSSATTRSFSTICCRCPQPIALRAVYDAMDNRTRADGKRRAIAQLVERSSRQQPRVLAVEDLHWADAPTPRASRRAGNGGHPLCDRAAHDIALRA